MRENLRSIYPEMAFPMRCENGCGAVIETIDAFISYKRNDKGENLLICQCCASEIGHLFETDEEPEDTPVCKRKPKTQRAETRT